MRRYVPIAMKAALVVLTCRGYLVQDDWFACSVLPSLCMRHAEI